MAYVSQPSAFIDQVTSAGRRITGAPDWPLVAASVLGVLSMIEVIARANVSADPANATANLSSGLLLALCSTMPLALARSYLLAASLTVAAGTMLSEVAYHQTTIAAMIAKHVLLYLVGRHLSRRLILLLLAPSILYAVSPLSVGVRGKLVAVALLATAAATAALGSARRLRLDAHERDASRQAVEDTRLEYVARGERARIARELHDVVAHHISMIAVQAETARLTTPGMPTEGARRLVAIGDTARTALTEMRRLLGVLRSDAGTEPTRAPQPGLEQLNELIDSARESAGASTRLIVHGHVVPLDPGIELTAYRIIQEALTNARRHARGAAVDVQLDFAGDALRLRVRDNGPGPTTSPAPAGAGHGLLGMGERAAMVGGTLWTGPSPAGGFLVEAVLPTVKEAA
jgi:signal transduction histidine kinase